MRSQRRKLVLEPAQPLEEAPRLCSRAVALRAELAGDPLVVVPESRDLLVAAADVRDEPVDL